MDSNEVNDVKDLKKFVLNNLINKVQVSDLKTKKEELSKQESTSDDFSMNFTIDEKKNKGHFGKFLVGYGSDNRYESSLLINNFNIRRSFFI